MGGGGLAVVRWRAGWVVGVDGRLGIGGCGGAGGGRAVSAVERVALGRWWIRMKGGSGGAVWGRRLADGGGAPHSAGGEPRGMGGGGRRAGGARRPSRMSGWEWTGGLG
ncbi:hypothetical protein GCM10017786_35560 [Amycolatopsis deserti]|uniref:Uncharacterized protein n=1 Tax=Amycolatopsis deserti TaxID=185696 RepID=A0ABQ3IZE9_9PSEU|nr:hypothetical protein GCM10017786_35560 [Amycolatopsis deserti]